MHRSTTRCAAFDPAQPIWNSVSIVSLVPHSRCWCVLRKGEKIEKGDRENQNSRHLMQGRVGTVLGTYIHVLWSLLRTKALHIFDDTYMDEIAYRTP